MTIFNISVTDDAKSAQITALVNAVSDGKKVKAFKNRATAVKRLTDVITTKIAGFTADEVAKFATSLPDDLRAIVSVTEAPATKNKNVFPHQTFTVISKDIRTRKTISVFSQLSFIVTHPGLTFAQVYEVYNRDNMPEGHDSTLTGKKASQARPLDRPGWINIKTFRLAIARGLITMTTPPIAEKPSATATSSPDATASADAESAVAA